MSFPKFKMRCTCGFRENRRTLVSGEISREKIKAIFKPVKIDWINLNIVLIQDY